MIPFVFPSCRLIGLGSFLTLMSALLCPPAIAAGAVSVEPTVSGIQSSIQARGAKATVAVLMRNDRWWGIVTRIRDGETAWIELAPALSAGEGAAYDLANALSYALLRNAPAVLAALNADHGAALDLARVCNSRYPYPIKAFPREAEGYGEKRSAAVAAVDEPALSQVKSACLTALARGPSRGY
jgi:hypothetical protein